MKKTLLIATFLLMPSGWSQQSTLLNPKNDSDGTPTKAILKLNADLAERLTLLSSFQLQIERLDAKIAADAAAVKKENGWDEKIDFQYQQSGHPVGFFKIEEKGTTVSGK